MGEYDQFRRSRNVEDRRKDPDPKLSAEDEGQAAFEAFGRKLNGKYDYLYDTKDQAPLGDLSKDAGLDDLPKDTLKWTPDGKLDDVPEGWDEDQGIPDAGVPQSFMSRPANSGVHQAIIDAARQHGIDPATALAIADRESRFNPSAKASKTIRGIYQMSGALRSQYGVGDSLDPAVQAQGWAKFYKDNKAEMAKRLGRDVTDTEAYSGHHFGGTRAARMMQMDPSTPVSNVFTSREMAENPHFAKAGTVGKLLSTVTGDIQTKAAKYGGQVDAPDFSAFGQPVLEAGPAQLPDFSRMGTPVEPLTASVQPPQGAPDFSNAGSPVV